MLWKYFEIKFEFIRDFLAMENNWATSARMLPINCGGSNMKNISKNRSIRFYDADYNQFKDVVKSEGITQAEFMHVLLGYFDKFKLEENKNNIVGEAIMKNIELKNIIKDKEIEIRNEKISILLNELKSTVEKEYRYQRESDELRIKLALKDVEKR